MKRTFQPNDSSESCRALSAPVSAALARIADDTPLTPTLRVRLTDLASGLTYHGISQQYGISMNTVKTEVRQLLARLGLYCRHEIDHAIEAAELRAEAGASADHLDRFLRLRWE